jgi:hypothetical protein
MAAEFLLESTYCDEEHVAETVFIVAACHSHHRRISKMGMAMGSWC